MKPIRLIAASILSIIGTTLCAQQTSPFSMEGYGVLSDHSSATQRSMGGVGYALQGRGRINVKNPASYAAIDSMTFLFDIGVNCGSVHTSDASVANNKALGGLDYITMQVPIGKWMGASLGILPYSTVGYQFGTEVTNGNSTYQGQGGISELYLGWAARPVKGLSVGLNAGYLFGNIINDKYVTATNGSVSLFETVKKVKDYNIQFGLQYAVDINRQHRVSLGAAYTLAHPLHGQGYGVKYDVPTSNEQVTAKPDTIGLTKLGARFGLPWAVGAGLAYSWDSRLTVAADFTYQPWSRAKYDGIEDFSTPGKLNDRIRLNLGGEYTPALRGNYFKRMTYRLGAYGAQDYITANGNDVRELGITCGFGFPTPLRTTVNLGFEYRHRASRPMATVTENYYMVTLGIALNEVWFVPSKLR